MPTHASFLYARNIANFMGLLVTDGQLAPDFDDEIVAGTCVVRAGTVVHGPTAEALGLAPPAPAPPSTPPPAEPDLEPAADTPTAEPPAAKETES
jgi:H+-translocating NAD(P) transhydrogenase subunit alpha